MNWFTLYVCPKSIVAISNANPPIVQLSRRRDTRLPSMFAMARELSCDLLVATCVSECVSSIAAKRIESDWIQLDPIAAAKTISLRVWQASWPAI